MAAFPFFNSPWVILYTASPIIWFRLTHLGKSPSRGKSAAHSESSSSGLSEIPNYGFLPTPLWFDAEMELAVGVKRALAEVGFGFIAVFSPMALAWQAAGGPHIACKAQSVGAPSHSFGFIRERNLLEIIRFA